MFVIVIVVIFKLLDSHAPGTSLFTSE